jgi:hypothetical protein
MAGKAIGDGWKAYLGGLRQGRRDERAEAALSPAGYPYAVPRPQRERPATSRTATDGPVGRN